MSDKTTASAKAKKVWDQTKTPVLVTALTVTSLYAWKKTRHVRFLNFYLQKHGLFDAYYAQTDAEVLRLIAEMS